jgi:Flp pilus assembly protein TadB
MPQGVDSQQREARHPRAPRGSPPGRGPRQAPAARRRGRRWAPLLILFVFAGAAMQLVIRALHEGDVEAAIVAIVMLMMVAFVAVRRFTKRKD